MSNEKRSLVDEIMDGARRLLDDLDRFVNPNKRRQHEEPVPIPVPVRPDRPPYSHDPYNHR